MNFNAKEYICGKVLRYVKHNKKIIIDFSDGIGLNKTYRFIFQNCMVNVFIDLVDAIIVDCKENGSVLSFIFAINNEEIEVIFKADKIYKEVFLTDDLCELYRLDSDIYQKNLKSVCMDINKDVYKIFCSNYFKLKNYYIEDDLLVNFSFFGNSEFFSWKFMNGKSKIIYCGIEITFDELLELFGGSIVDKEVSLRIKKCRYGIEVGILLDLVRKIEIIIKCKGIEVESSSEKV